MTDLSRRIADYTSALRYEDLPVDVVHQTKRTILDTVGCAFGGYHSKPSDIAHDLAATISSTSPATIWCSGIKTSVDLAAFTNDVMVRYLDHNDGYISSGSGHPSDTVAALIPIAEMLGSSGRELIVATVAAYEVFGRMCDVWANKKSGIDHVTMGIAASTVGAARLYGLDATQTAEALNISLAANIALNQTRFGNVSNWKAAGYANANRNAIFSVEMAKRGMTGPSPIFEGKYGFFNIVSSAPFELEPFGGADHTFRIMHSSCKRFPLGQYAQTVAQAALDARQAIGGRYRDIAKVTAATLKTGLLVMADEPDKWAPSNRETADHSMPFTASVALKYGSVKHEHFDNFADPELVDLVSRIACVESDEANARESEMNLCLLEVEMKSGEKHRTRVEFHRGHWRNPMTDAEMEEKFRELSSGVLPEDQATALMAELWALDDARSVEQLVSLTILPRT